MEEAITCTIVKHKIDTVNETDKPQASKSKKDKSIRNKSNKGRSFDIQGHWVNQGILE